MFSTTSLTSQGRTPQYNLPEEKQRRYTSTYEYNAQGSLVRSINYAGVVKETVFDDKGRKLKKITYNLDDPTSKFYEESKRDDKGKVTADIDESGEYDSVTYTYDQNGEVAVQTDGKGNKTAYGYKEGNLVSISGNTDGEESINTMRYNASLLTKVSNDGTVYNYEYDGWGRSINIKICGEKFFISTEYTDELNSTTTMADGTTITSVSDTHGNTIEQTVKYSEKLSEAVKNDYDKETGTLTGVSVLDKDKKTVYTIKYEHDHKGNVTSETHTRKSKEELVKKCKYNADNELESTTYEINGGTPFEYTYETDRTPDRRDAKVGLPCGLNQVLVYDGLGRTKEVALGDNLVKDIYYAKYGDHATNRVNAVWHGVNGIRKENTRYTYDKAGNIETVTENGKLVARYQYDGLNRLVREDNVRFGTFTYQYDVAGNILSKTEYAFTTEDKLGESKSVKEYSYKQHGWKDQLVSYTYTNAEGKDVVEDCGYDKIGNPDINRGKKLTWQGRRLTEVVKGAKSATYTYDFNGMRASKTLVDEDAKTTFNVEYVYDGNNLIAEQREKKLITYFYGVDGVAGFEYNGDTYLYRKNVQGDITHIYKQLSNGKLEIVAQYVYDAWGNHKVLDAKDIEIKFDTTSIAHINPFRYRSYYFDVETKLYYLQTRYYDPELCRFISADSIEYLDPETLGGLNLYAYCSNNPIMSVDPEGTSSFWNALGKIFVAVAIIAVLAVATVLTAGTAAGVIVAGAFVGAALGAASGVVSGAIEASQTGKNMFDCIANKVLSGTIVGGLSGALAGTGFGVGVQILGNMALNTGEYLITSAINHEDPTWEGFINSAIVGFVAGIFGGDGAMFGQTGLLSSLIREPMRNIAKVVVPIATATLAGLVTSIGQSISELLGLQKKFKKGFGR